MSCVAAPSVFSLFVYPFILKFFARSFLFLGRPFRDKAGSWHIWYATSMLANEESLLYSASCMTTSALIVCAWPKLGIAHWTLLSDLLNHCYNGTMLKLSIETSLATLCYACLFDVAHLLHRNIIYITPLRQICHAFTFNMLYVT